MSIRAKTERRTVCHVGRTAACKGFYEKWDISLWREFDDCGKMHIHMKRRYKLI